MCDGQVYEQLVRQVEDEQGELPDDLPKSASAEQAANHPQVQNMIAPRLTMLMEIANSFLLTIIESKESVPYGIRWICKQIRSLTRVRNGSAVFETSTSCSCTAQVP
jgi:Ras GTPase-activating-like protein IQGAP2/3